MPQYQGFTIPTITPDQQSGWQSASQGLSGLTQAISQHMLDTQKQQDAIKTLMLKNQLENSSAITKAKAVKDAEFALEQKRLEQHIKNVQTWPDYFRKQGEIVPDHWSDQNPNHSSYDVPQGAGQSQNPVQQPAVTQPSMNQQNLPAMSMQGGGVGTVQGQPLSLNPIMQARAGVGQGIATQPVNPIQAQQNTTEPYQNIYNPINNGYIRVPRKDYISPQQIIATKDREAKQQDTLESHALDKLSGIRGDTPMKTIETQRDAASQAYGLLSDVRKEGRYPNKMEITDIAGQLWKSRTGTAPTEQVLHDLVLPTLFGKFSGFKTFWTSKPQDSITPEMYQSIKGFIENTGSNLDVQHDAYMKTHLKKPFGLSQERWDNIKDTKRGASFSDMKQMKDSTNTDTTNNGNAVSDYQKFLAAIGSK